MSNVIDQWKEHEKLGNIISKDIERLDDTIGIVSTGWTAFYHGPDMTYLEDYISDDQQVQLRKLTSDMLIELKAKKETELEQLLGIRKPGMIINPKFEAAVQEMVNPVKKDSEPEVVIPDMLGNKFSKIIDKQEQQIKAAQDPVEKSLDKFPAKKKSPYPESMTEAAVRELYINQGKTITQVAIHFGVPYPKANSFITGHKLHRNQQEQAKQPAEKERP